MADSVHVSSEEIMQIIQRHVNCLGEDNRNTRKRAIEAIKKETLLRNPPLEVEVIHGVLGDVLKPLLKILSDPVEKCRELAILLVSDSFTFLTDCAEYLPYLFPVLVQRLGQQEITETAEELRLTLVQLISKIVQVSGKNVHLYLDDIIRILQRTIIDPYPEVKKESCRCSSALAKAIPQHFHMQSESLIKPLLQTISHQHSKVRVEVIKAIGDVIRYGNNKSVDDVVSHLAQRLFDQSPSVRLAVTIVVGHWLLELLDRYSFFHKLIPLLLTSLTDELPEIRHEAEALWHDCGLLYASENEKDLKDKMDFMKADMTHYPASVERPNIGCRELVYRNLSKILPGLLRDLVEWLVETRIKSAQLLYTLLLNAEDNSTQHMERLLSGLCRASHDEDKTVIEYVGKCAEMIGYFVSPEVWCKMILQTVKSGQSQSGSLMILSGILRGSEKSLLLPFLNDICDVLISEEVSKTGEDTVQTQLLSCVDSILLVSQEEVQGYSLSIFSVLLAIKALTRDSSLAAKVDEQMVKLAVVQGHGGVLDLYRVHTQQVLDSYRESCGSWTNHSPDRLIFETLLLEAGVVVGDHLDLIVPMIVTNLQPSKDPEIRLKIFNLLSRLMMNASSSLDSSRHFGDFAAIVVKDMVLPNLVWMAGRTAGAIRTIAVSCLWALLQSGVLTKEKMIPVIEDLITQLITTIEDDAKTTRLVTCRCLSHIFCIVGSALDQDRLHNIYPDFLKRLDDSSDDIRVAVTKTFVAYFDCFTSSYDAVLYRAHLEAIYRGLLVHLDDPEKRIQEAVLDVLKKAAMLHPALLSAEIDLVKHKHRSPFYCNQLMEFLHTLKT